ncbi:DUF3137 domain-containing protein [Zhouia spongiae]|uniref:DUF3137 domain-containing protein n=1 Tax=Zhouia spongiae TaxID=2202721 RepID=A0ABY3YL79_9FLAO|nr:DUF3137 domain-containing protein [Zhouia spongiae]UNY98596.1 DUF3137 domain-containing protein [Zhouia spongiae]
MKRVYAEVSNDLSVICQKRKRTLFFQRTMWLITGLYFVFMLLLMATNYFPDSANSFFYFFEQFKPTSDNPYASIYPLIGLMVLLYLTTYVFAGAFRKFKIKETETMAKMVKMLFPKLRFAQNTAVPANEIVKSKLFAWVRTNATMYNYGQLRSVTNGKAVNIADIGIVEENVSNKIADSFMRVPILNMMVILYQFVLRNIFTNKSADNVYYTFRGMFCWLGFKKSLKGHTVILTNNQNSKLNRFFSSNFKEEQRINLEDPRFTNQFIVYSTDQVEARYVLSTALMERIVALKEKFNQPILLSFQNQQMYLAVKNENGLFSFPTGELASVKIIEELAHDIETALQIGTELK